MEALGAAAVLGFVLGLQHATDPDHLVAIATIVSRERRFGAAASLGLLWGVGHTVALAGTGAVLLTLAPGLPGTSWAGMELLVAVLLIALGVVRLREAFRDVHAVSPDHLVSADHLVADHDHGTEAFHSHLHAHGGMVHRHPHVHPSRRFLRVLRARGRGLPTRAVLVGAVQGLAGSAAVSLVVAGTMRTGAGAAFYLAVFGLGTIAGMLVLTAVLAFPVTLALRAERLRRGLGVAAGGGSIVFGVAYALRLL